MPSIRSKLSPETMRALRAKPGPMPLKIADVLWPNAVMRTQHALTRFNVGFFRLLDRRSRKKQQAWWDSL